VKLFEVIVATYPATSFSILERIDVGETPRAHRQHVSLLFPFSILERIDVGETNCWRGCRSWRPSFSILERIDVGETCLYCWPTPAIPTFSILERIDVGETWRFEPG